MVCGSLEGKFNIFYIFSVLKVDINLLIFAADICEFMLQKVLNLQNVDSKKC